MMAATLFRRQLFCALLALPAIACAPVAAADYVAVDLYALRAPQGLVDPVPFNIAGGQTVGEAFAPHNTVHAVLWNRDGSAVDLNPGGFPESQALGTDGLRQFGVAYPSAQSTGGHAVTWGGSAASAVDLNPVGFLDSIARGLFGTQLVGSGAPSGAAGEHALLWNSMDGNAVDLQPTNLIGFASSTAIGTNGVQQVGSGGGPATTDTSHYVHVHALLWNGKANSGVDLNPTNLPGITDSNAVATNGRQQVGEGLGRALLWSGTADSAVNLNPSGFAGSEALGLSADRQVGWGTPIGTDNQEHALVWSGTASSAIDLHLLLPQAFTSSAANSIDAEGDVFGTAFNSSDFQWHAIEWLPHPVLPGDADLNGTVDFSDLLALAQHYGQSGGWVNGDFNDDGTVNFADLLLLAQNYGQSLSGSAAVASVPEPRSLSLLVGATGLARRRR